MGHVPLSRASASRTASTQRAQPTLPLWDDPEPNHLDRIVADARDRAAWLRARASGITATDAARLAGDSSVDSLAAAKLSPYSFGGNAFTRHGVEREPDIAAWAGREHGMTPNTALFHAPEERRHLATPDGIRVRGTVVELCEIKTTSSSWRSIPRHYLRQIWWQQYVLGAERTLLVWEEHRDFEPLSTTPRTRWIDRDDEQISRLTRLAEEVLSKVSIAVT